MEEKDFMLELLTMLEREGRLDDFLAWNDEVNKAVAAGMTDKEAMNYVDSYWYTKGDERIIDLTRMEE